MRSSHVRRSMRMDVEHLEFADPRRLLHVFDQDTCRNMLEESHRQAEKMAAVKQLDPARFPNVIASFGSFFMCADEDVYYDTGVELFVAGVRGLRAASGSYDARVRLRRRTRRAIDRRAWREHSGVTTSLPRTAPLP